MKRLTFEGNFCDIAQCTEIPGGSFCEDGVCYCNEYGGAITPEDYCSRAVRENEPHAR